MSTPNFRIGGVSIVVVKQGPLHRTKLVENGRRHRKNWSSAHTVLTDTFLLFFKDQVRAYNYLTLKQLGLFSCFHYVTKPCDIGHMTV